MYCNLNTLVLGGQDAVFVYIIVLIVCMYCDFLFTGEEAVGTGRFGSPVSSRTSQDTPGKSGLSGQWETPEAAEK